MPVTRSISRCCGRFVRTHIRRRGANAGTALAWREVRRRDPDARAGLGHEPGMEITTPDQIGDYLQALAKAAPTRTRLDRIRAHLGRAAAVGDGDRQPGADRQARSGQARSAAAGRSARRCRRATPSGWSRKLPVVTWLSHGVHGNEISSGDAALFEAYHLLASQGDADVDVVLRESLVLIDPMQNPDGRARFMFQNLQGRAAVPDPTPYNAEHDEPWPGGRSNHYLFDMNRDWFAQTQPETRGRITIAREYWPHVTVDLHEQGGDNTYYFAPPADPLNPHITKSQIAAFDLFGRANARAFRRARLAVLHSRGLRLVLSRLRRVVADLPGLDRHDLRAGVGAQPVVRATRRHGADLSRRRHAPRQRRAGHRDHGGQESRAPACASFSSIAAAPSPKARRAPAASTCCCPGTIRRAPTAGRATLRRRASRCAARKRRSRSATAAAGRHISRFARAADRPADSQPARSGNASSRRTSSSGRKSGARGVRPTRSTTSPRGTCRCSTTSSW